MAVGAAVWREDRNPSHRDGEGMPFTVLTALPHLGRADGTLGCRQESGGVLAESYRGQRRCGS